MELSVVIAGRNEEFFAKTVENVIENSTDQTEVIAVADGYKPYPSIMKHPRVRIMYLNWSIGQRAAVNLGVSQSMSKYIMKLDAHCAVDKFFDIKLMKDCDPDWTVIPRMYNLHAYQWKCFGCGKQAYQGKKFDCCGNVKKKMIWQPKKRSANDYMTFDAQLHFQYWSEYSKRPEANGQITDQMCAIGACWFMERKRWDYLDGLDEAHGGWGQVGVEIACKSWLSGGKQVVNKNTWFAHLFRTGNFRGTGHNGGTFPYPLSNSDVEKARQYSRNLWLNNNWPKQKHKLEWFIERFKPIPGWHE